MTQQFPTALITGASGRLGQALATCFAQQGYQLVLIARNVKTLNQVAGQLTQDYRIPVKVLPQNLARLGAADAIAKQLQETQLTVDVLVNNASLEGAGEFWQADPAREITMIQVNITTLTYLTRLLLPGMVERGAGKVLNIASTAAFAPEPLRAVYGATKAYVLSFSEALAGELQGTGVQVTVLCPGAIAPFPPTEAQVLTAEAIAQAGYDGLMRGQVIVIPGLRHPILTFFWRLLPWPVVRSLMRRRQSRSTESLD